MRKRKLTRRREMRSWRKKTGGSEHQRFPEPEEGNRDEEEENRRFQAPAVSGELDTGNCVCVPTTLSLETLWNILTTH